MPLIAELDEVRRRLAKVAVEHFPEQDGSRRQNAPTGGDGHSVGALQRQIRQFVIGQQILHGLPVANLGIVVVVPLGVVGIMIIMR